QQRRLREQEAEKEHLRLSNETSRLSRVVERAKEVAALVDAIKRDETDIAAFHAGLTDKSDLLQQAQESAESDASELASLRQHEVVAGYRSAIDKAAAARERKALGHNQRQQADVLDSQ